MGSDLEVCYQTSVENGLILKDLFWFLFRYVIQITHSKQQTKCLTPVLFDFMMNCTDIWRSMYNITFTFSF